jgi:hypothetical protein
MRGLPCWPTQSDLAEISGLELHFGQGLFGRTAFCCCYATAVGAYPFQSGR